MRFIENTAQKIIDKFGNQSQLSKLMGKAQSTVQHWTKTGIIPSKYHAQLFELARREGVDLKPSDFYNEVTLEVKPKEEVSEFPKATHWGELAIGEIRIPCWVLETGDRIFSLKGVVRGLMNTEGGQLSEYIKTQAIRPLLPSDLQPSEDNQYNIDALLKFDTGGEGFTKFAWGVPVEKFIDICAAFSQALQKHLSKTGPKLTTKQLETAIRANTFLMATAKVGIVSLVDEATGYQYEREYDALQFKLNLYLAEEMRKWEKTFPDELWSQFGRLTNWSGQPHQRPKYFGKLVMELVYEYLDSDVAKWLKKNAPKPQKGQNYHQWMTSQYGLKKLIEHIWMLIGIASTCQSVSELKVKMAQKYGRIPVQLTLFVTR